MFKIKHTGGLIVLLVMLFIGILFLGNGITGLASYKVASGVAKESLLLGIIMIVVLTFFIFDFNKIFNKK